MKKYLLSIVVVAVALFTLAASPSYAQSNTSYNENLQTCLNGNFRSLCRHSILTPSDARRVEEAEHRANFSTCLNGNFRSLCQYSILTAEERRQVEEAEY